VRSGNRGRSVTGVHRSQLMRKPEKEVGLRAVHGMCEASEPIGRRINETIHILRI
jgi:hypothetical protein